VPIGFDNADYIVARQPAEQEDLVESVQELRAERGAHRLHDLPAHRIDRLVLGQAREVLAPEVRGQHDQGVAEIDSAALPVCQPPVVEHLQQDVEHIGVGLFRPRRRGSPGVTGARLRRMPPLRCVQRKIPKPPILTSSPSFSAPLMPANTASTTRIACPDWQRTHSPGARRGRRRLEFFAANIRNSHARGLCPVRSARGRSLWRVVRASVWRRSAISSQRAPPRVEAVTRELAAWSVNNGSSR
jgi:hypothetical protein